MKRLFSRPSRHTVLSLSFWVALVLGLGIRLVGITFDLPLVTHPDEPKVVNAVIDMFQRRSFEPNEFTWPGHLVMMAGYFVGTAYSYLVLGMGPETAIEQVDPYHWYISTRIAVALIGSAAIVLAYLIGRRFNHAVGVISSVLVALYPPFVVHSHYATADMTLVATVLLVVLFAQSYYENPRYPALVAMSFAVALAVATKYPGLIAAGLIAVVVGVRAFQDRDLRRFVSHGFVSVVALGLSLFVISPKLFTERGMVLRSVANESKTVHAGADGLTYVEKLGFYWSDYFADSGYILLVPLLIGAVAVIRFKVGKALPLFVGVLFWLVLSFLALHWDRWGLPMYITPLFLTALGVHYLFDAVRNKVTRYQRLVMGGAVAISVVATTNLMVNALAESVTLLPTDTRVLAAQDFADRGITREQSIFEGYTVFAPNYPARIFTDFQQTDELILLEPSVDYAITSSFMVNRYFADDKYETEQRFYALLESQYPVVAQYSPEGSARSSANPLINIPRQIATMVAVARGDFVKGPTITVYDLAGRPPG